MSGAVFVGTLQLQHDLAGAVTLEPFVGDGRPGDVTAELLEFFTLIGTPAQPHMEAKAVRVDPSSGLDGLALLDRLLCGCQAHYIRDLFFLSSFMTTVLPDQRETCCYAWHGTRSSHLLGMRPSLRHKAPGSLSQASNRQEFFSPGSACRRVVPWGDVSSWVKG